MLSRSLLPAALGLLAAVTPALAQVTTSCQPLNSTCPPDPAFGMDYTFYFNTTPSSDAWETTAGTVSFTPNEGAIFTINKQGDSPTIRTKFYFFFGRTEMWLKTSPGTGIISSMMMLSDDLDEVDWEFFGGNASYAETNYFGKGRQDFHNAIYYPVQGGVQADYHNYTTVWTQDALQWYIDGTLVRTLTPNAANNTNNYPQTPMRLSLGIWAGGDPSLPLGTRQWAGGDTDYSQGPFNMYIKSARITDYNQGSQYTYSDMSGSWESIKVTTGNSTAKQAILAPPPQTLADKWNAMSPTSHIAIYASAGGAGALLLFVALFYCIRQRRRGAREAKLADARFEAERLELQRFKAAGIDPDSFADHGAEYSASDFAKEGLANRDSYSVPATPVNNVSRVDGGEKSWEAAGMGAAAGNGYGRLDNGRMDDGMRSPVPLLREGAQSPRVASPGPMNGARGPYPGAPSPGGRPSPPQPQLVSPIRTASPGMPPNFPPPASPAGYRSASSPNAYMRMGSPGPQQGFGAPQRMNSPSPMNPPVRSFSAPRQQQQQQQQQQPQGYGGYRLGPQVPQVPQRPQGEDYWGQGGYRR